MSYVYSSASDVRRSTDGPALFLDSSGLLEFPSTDIVQIGKAHKANPRLLLDCLINCSYSAVSQ